MANARDLAEVVHTGSAEDVPPALQQSIEQAEAIARDWLGDDGLDLYDENVCHALMAVANLLAATEANVRLVEDDAEAVLQAERIVRLAIWHVASRRWLHTVDGVQT